MKDNTIKVFILGSCVSRDPFELDDKKEFEVVNYIARSSLASLIGKPYIDKKIIDNLDSQWLQKQLHNDMEKSLFLHLLDKEFDILLMDFIDERFDLSIKKEVIHTASTEYKEALYTPNQYNTIKGFSDEKFKLWEQGLKKLVDFLTIHKLIDTVVLNRVYWTNKIGENGVINTKYSTDYIKKANDDLERMYLKIIQLIPNIKIIDYPKNILFSDPNHKWGLAPFHYNNLLMQEQLLRLKECLK